MTDVLCFTAGRKALNCYVHAVTICNSLALLISQGSSKDFEVRIALLNTLQKCWLNGHSVLQLVCSCDGTVDIVFSDPVVNIVSGSSVHFTEDVNGLDIQSPKLCNDNSDAEAWADSAAEVKSECLNASDFVTTKSVVAAQGSEPLHFCYISYMCNC